MICELFDKKLVIESARLILRPLKPSDSEDLFEIFSDKHVMEYYNLPAFKNISEAVNQVDVFISSLKNKTMIRWGIELKDSRKLIGTCGLFSISEESRKAEMGYELNRKYWNRGIMTEALRTVMNFIFSQTDINRIEAFVEIPNTSSQKLLNKLGFTKEGILRQYELCRGELIDITIWGYLRNDNNL